jgi:hypothetical protein
MKHTFKTGRGLKADFGEDNAVSLFPIETGFDGFFWVFAKPGKRKGRPIHTNLLVSRKAYETMRKLMIMIGPAETSLAFAAGEEKKEEA